MLLYMRHALGFVGLPSESRVWRIAIYTILSVPKERFTSCRDSKGGTHHVPHRADAPIIQPLPISVYKEWC